MTSEVSFARRLADTVLSRLRADGGPTWSVLEIGSAGKEVPPLRDSGHVRITLGDAASHECPVWVHFTITVPLTEAVIATTDQIQEHMLEATRGVPLPACPGHQHPLRAAERDGVAMWVCPQGRTPHAEPVLPRNTPG